MQNFLLFLFSGLLTGILLSAPVGPANVLCLEKTLKSGSGVGFIVGAGAALGDLIFVILALMGMVVIGDFQNNHSDIMKYIGSAILVIFATLSFYKGISRARQKDAQNNLLELYAKNQDSKKAQKLTAASGFLTNFFLTVTNPLTPIGVISAVAAVGLGSGALKYDPILMAVLFTLGTIIGSLGWWYSLTRVAAHFAKNLTGRSLSIVNYIGCVIMLFTALYIFWV